MSDGVIRVISRTWIMIWILDWCLSLSEYAPCGLRVVRIDLLRFLAGCHTRQLNQVYFLFYILACVIWYCCLLGPLIMYC